jgi:flagellar basal-body rod modification protein FlgD
MTSPIGPTESVSQALGQQGTANSSATDATGSTNQLNQQTFLKLLVAQLQYQNPDSPTDPSAYLQQTATFTQVQSLQDMEKSMSTLLAAQQTTQANSMLGRTVTWTDSSGKTPVQYSGVVTSVSPDASGTTGPTLGVSVSGSAGTTSVALNSITTVTDTPTATTSA